MILVPHPPGSSAAVRYLALGGVVLAVALGGAALVWWGLPRWTPLLVIHHSPWLSPLLRAAAVRSDVEAEEAVAARIAAWGALAVPGLTAALDDSDRRVAVRAAAALGSTADAHALAPLLSALARGEARLRVAAATGLGRLRDRGAVGPLVHALDDPDDATVMAAADALGRIGDPAAIDGLLALLRSDEDLVRDGALRNLVGLALSDAQRRVVEAYQRSIR